VADVTQSTAQLLEREATPPAPAEQRLGRRRHRLTGLVAVVLVGSMTAVPAGVLLWNSFKLNIPGQEARYGVGNWTRAFNPGVREAAVNTILLGVTRTLIGLVIACTLAWLIARTNMIGGKVVEVVLWLSFFVPSLSMTFGWILLLEPADGLINQWVRSLLGLSATEGPFNIFGFWGITLVHLSSTTVPFMCILLIPAFRRMGTALEEAAQTCGASRLKTTIFVTLPMMTPALLGAALLTFIYSLKAFEVELLLGTPVNLRVYSTQIYQWIQGTPPEFGIATALGVVFVPLLIGLSIAQRLVLRRRSYVTVGSHTYSGDTIRLRPVARIGWTVAAWAYVAVMVILPLSACIVGSFMKRFGFFSIEHPFTTDNWTSLFERDQFWASLGSSLRLGLATTLAGMLLYCVVSYLIVRSSLPNRGLIDVLAWLPVALPGILLGLGLLWLALATPLRTVLYGGLLGLTLALVVGHMATGTQQMKTALMQISPDHEHAARTCGAGPVRAYFAILLPLVAPAAIAAGILTFNSAITDISTVTLLSTGEFKPLSVMMLEYGFSNQREQAAALGVMMSCVTVFVGALATVVAGRRERRRRRLKADPVGTGP
jgi:iron(III) transport system permease protein